MNVVKDIWTKSFIHNTYSCIEGRGIHLCANNLKRDLRKYPNETTYCLKLDIRKFYPSIPHDGLKKCIRKKIKDKDFLMILDEIIDSTDNVRDISSKLTNKIGIGVPIGNYLSQYFANLYLSELDHLCKEELKCKFYYRYADDIVILSDNKDFLHKVLIYIKLYVHTIGLKVKDNYQIYPVNSRGINFIKNGKAYYADSRDKTLFYSIHRLNHFPINFKITKYDWRIYAKNRKEKVKPQT